MISVFSKFCFSNSRKRFSCRAAIQLPSLIDANCLKCATLKHTGLYNVFVEYRQMSIDPNGECELEKMPIVYSS